jgi:hypothetical protein
MKHVIVMTGALLTMIALSAARTAAAQAEEAPYWTIEGTRLAAGKTAEVTAKALTSKVLTAGTTEIACTRGELAKGSVLVGSNAGEPGKSEGIVKLSGCRVTGNGEPCEIASPGKEEVATAPLVGELGYATNKKSLVGVASPKKGKIFATIKFTGSGCKETETEIRGSIAGGILTDGEVLLELPNAVAQATSFIGKSLDQTKSNVWLIKGGVGSEVETEELNAFGHEAKLSGTDLASLASGKDWAPEL